jgi:hypothetical protein
MSRIAVTPNTRPDPKGATAMRGDMTQDPRTPDRSCASTAGSSSVEPAQLKQISRQEQKRMTEMMPAVLPGEQRHFVFGRRPVPAPRPGQVFASRRIAGPDGETQASLIIAPAPPRSSQED